MLIKPFKTMENNHITETIKSVKTDISFIPYADNNHRDVLVVSKKYLINNFSSKLGPSLIKIVYTFYTENKCVSNIRNKKELSEANIGRLHLQYITTSLYDAEETHYFGNLIYDLTTHSQCVNTVLTVKQNPKDHYYKINDLNVDYITKSALFVEIESDDIEDGLKFRLVDSKCKNYQLQNFRIRTVRSLSEFINDANVRLSSYDVNIKNKFDSFNTTSLLSIAQTINSENYELSTESVMIHNKTNDIIVKKDTLIKVLSDLTQANILSLVDNITFVYDDGKLNIPEIEYPFDKVYRPFINRAMMIYKDFILGALNEAQQLLGRLKCIVSISDGFSIGYMKLYEEDELNEFKTICYSDELISSYIYDKCKSRRFRRLHPSFYEGLHSEIYTMMNYFYDPFEGDSPF